MDAIDFSIMVGKMAIIYGGMIQVVPVMIWVERKGAALIQDRPGPNRVGPFGIFQPIADAAKFIFKEDPIPDAANPVLYVLGPVLILIPASLTIAALPFGDYAVIFDRRISLQIADLDIALLYVLAIGSLGVYGILFGGWASNNKYSLMGSMRAASQVISYKIPLGLAAANAVLLYGTFSLKQMVYAQEGLLFGFLPNWGIFFQPLGFLIFFITMFAETNRLPFDMAEAEPELVGGYHTEYGSMKSAMFFMAEYLNLATASAMMTVLYFGGWHLPFISDAQLLVWVGSDNLVALIQVLTVIAKISIFMCIFVWVRWTIPRFRFDQLMSLAWRTLIPLSLFNIIVTAVLLYWLEGK